MDDTALLERITIDADTLAGKPVIKGTRLSVDYIINLLAHDTSFDEIQQEYPDLKKDDILACLLFAKNSVESAVFFPPSSRVS